MFTPNREELAWAAGFFDGEGCFYNLSEKPRYPLTKINQTAKEPLERFRAAVGGVGSITGPRVGKRRNGDPSKEFWTYAVFGFEKTQFVYALLFKYLCSVKKTQGKKVLVATEHRKLKWTECKRVGHNIKIYDKKENKILEFSVERKKHTHIFCYTCQKKKSVENARLLRAKRASR